MRCFCALQTVPCEIVYGETSLRGRKAGSTDTRTLYDKTKYPDDREDSETDSEESDVSGSDGDEDDQCGTFRRRKH